MCVCVQMTSRQNKRNSEGYVPLSSASGPANSEKCWFRCGLSSLNGRDVECHTFVFHGNRIAG